MWQHSKVDKKSKVYVACHRGLVGSEIVRGCRNYGCVVHSIMTEETRYKLLKILSDNSDVSQRELADELGISLGKVNYCLKALKDKGLIKARNFKSNPIKRGYLYVLTPKGIEEKSKVTVRFFKRKIEEYELLKQEIGQLRQEVISSENSIK